MKITRIIRKFSSKFLENRLQGLFHLEKNEIPEAVFPLTEAFKEAKRLADPNLISETIDLLCYTHFSLSDFSALSDNLEQKLSFVVSRNPSEVDLLRILKNLFKCYFDSNQFDKAFFVSSQFPQLCHKKVFSKQFKTQMRVCEISARIVLNDLEPTFLTELQQFSIDEDLSDETKGMILNNMGVLHLINPGQRGSLERAESLFLESLFSLEKTSPKNTKSFLKHIQLEKVNLTEPAELFFRRNYLTLQEFAKKPQTQDFLALNNKHFDVPVANLVQTKVLNKQFQDAQIWLILGLQNLQRLNILDNMHRFWFLAHFATEVSLEDAMAENNLNKAARFAIINESVIKNIILEEYALFLEKRERRYEARRVFEMRGVQDMAEFVLKEWIVVDDYFFGQN